MLDRRHKWVKTSEKHADNLDLVQWFKCKVCGKRRRTITTAIAEVWAKEIRRIVEGTHDIHLLFDKGDTCPLITRQTTLRP